MAAERGEVRAENQSAAGRVCASCGLWKPATDFYRKAGHVSGLSSDCRPCNRLKKNAKYRSDVERGRFAAPSAPGRVCARCGVWKPASECYRGSRHNSGLYSYCRSCNAAVQKGKYQKNLAKNPEEFRRKRRAEKYAWGERYPDRLAASIKRQNLRKAARRAGVTVDEVVAMLEAQRHRCAICGGSQTTRRLSLDHDHKSGELRGLLCDGCNLGIGKFDDDPDLLRRAATYVEVHRAR